MAAKQKYLLFSALFLPLLLVLGYWQLQRADEKQEILDQYQTNRQQLPLTDIRLLDTEQDFQYRQASIQGELENKKIIILDNRVKYSRPGYEILQAVTVLGSSKKLLVNRYWVPADLDRSVLPEYPLVTGNSQLKGYLYRTLEGGYRLDDGVKTVSENPPELDGLLLSVLQNYLGSRSILISSALTEIHRVHLKQGGPLLLFSQKNILPTRCSGLLWLLPYAC